MASKVCAAIDVGSFEIAMKIYEIGSRKGIRELDHVRVGVDLGSESYATGRLGAKRVAEIIRILREFDREMKTWGVSVVRACGTSALRESENVDMILERIEKSTGIRIELLSNSEQRFLDYKAAALKSDQFDKMIGKPSAIVDIGGGSIQISLFDDERLVTTQNLKLGVLRIHEMLQTLGAGTARYDALVAELVGAQLSVFSRMYLADRKIGNVILVDDYVSPLMQNPRILSDSGLLGDGGTIPDKGHVTADGFINFIDHVQDESKGKNAEKLGVPYENLPLVYISGLIIKCIAKEMGAEDLWAPGVTLCDGIAWEYAEKKGVLGKHHDFEKDIIASAYNISTRFRGNKKRSELIGELAVRIFDAMKPVHGLGDRERLLLRIAAVLHDCGKYISMINLGETSYSIIMGSEIIGLSHRERQTVAAAVRYIYTEVPPPDSRDRVVEQFDDSMRRTLIKLTAMLRVATGLDRSHLKKFKKAVFTLEGDELQITANTIEDTTLESGLFEDRAVFFEEVFGVRPVIRRKNAK